MSKLNVERLRTHFPELVSNPNHIFLDGPGGTKVPEVVAQAVAHFMVNYAANRTSNDTPSVRAVNGIVETARESAVALLNAPSSKNIVFGESATSQTIDIAHAMAREWEEGDEIILTLADHQSNVSVWEDLAKQKGVKIHTVPVNEDTTLDYDFLEAHLNENTKLVACTMASNVTGSITDGKKVVELTRANAPHAKIYMDGVHFTPHNLPDVQAIGCDFFVCSAYKFGGPHMSVLFGTDEALEGFTPYKVRPASDEAPDRWETGTRSFEALAGFVAVVDFWSRSYKLEGKDDYQALFTRLFNPSQREPVSRERIRAGLTEYYADLSVHEQSLTSYFLKCAKDIGGLHIHGITDFEKLKERTPTFAITIDGMDDLQSLVDKLDKDSITTGASHFYAQRLVEDALGHKAVLRMGASSYTTRGEIERTLDRLKLHI